MKRWLLAIVALLGGTALLVHADYVVIKVNLAATKDKEDETGQPNAGGPGVMAPGGGGSLSPGGGPGVPGAPGGMGLGGTSFGGRRAGRPGGQSVRPGGIGPGGDFGGGEGGVGDAPNPAGGRTPPGGAPRGAGGAGPGAPGGGRGGRDLPGMGVGEGRGGGDLGVGGGEGPGSSFTTKRGPVGEDDEPDSTPLFVGAIVEVEHRDVKNLQSGRTKIKHRWGETTLYVDKEIEVAVILGDTIKQRYETEKRKIRPNDPARADRLLELAEWALAHGLLEHEGLEKEIPTIMKEIATIDPKNKAVQAFQKTQEAMDREIARDDEAFSWKDRLGDLKVKRSKHYTLLYDVKNDVQAENRLKRLEQNYQGFFYWFALHGVILPVPDRRLVAALIERRDSFESKHNDIFDEAPVVVDAFFARRDNLAVFSGQRLDEGYQALYEINQREGLFQKWKKSELLQGKGSGRGVAMNEVARAQTMVLLLKAMQEEGELASVSYEGTRQLIAAVGLLPRSVQIPQWIDYAMGSFFETPEGSFWPGTGGANMVHLVNYKLWEQTNQLEKEPIEALKSVITDRYFHRVADSKKKEAALNKARTMTWALTYYLAQNKREGLLRYYQELSNLPRDLQFDEEALLTTFAQAFGLMDDKKPNEVDANKLKNFASGWYQFMHRTNLEVKDVLDDAIRKHKKGVKAAARDKSKSSDKDPGDGGYIP